MNVCYDETQRDCIHREKAGEAVKPNALATTSVVDDDDGIRTKGGLSGYAALSMMEDTNATEPDEEDFGGLMVRIYL